jgi:hypothetical protein
MLQNGYLILSELPNVGVTRGRRRCNDCPAIDIRDPHHRELVDRPGSRISWRWNRNGESHCSIDLVFYRDNAVLTDVTDRERPRTLSISLLRTACNYGGTRPWFGCPACSNRCAILHFHDGHFRCRKCHGLGYRSQVEASSERPRLIAQRIRRSLGGSVNLGLPFPAKPPKMHWRTYYRIRQKGEHFEARATAGLADWFNQSTLSGSGSDLRSFCPQPDQSRADEQTQTTSESLSLEGVLAARRPKHVCGDY